MNQAEKSVSLSWDAYQNNICKGLSVLQQHGEFVDMTLAADGHHVKVHQMVLSLASSYIKDLISTAQCPHPVIFLNNINYATLCALLEYVYTGEAVVQKDLLPDLIAAGRALHIKGLKEMENPYTSEINSNKTDQSHNFNKIYSRKQEESIVNESQTAARIFVNCNDSDDDKDNNDEQNMEVIDSLEAQDSLTDLEERENVVRPYKKHLVANKKIKEYRSPSNVQYSISNQGNLQVIVNRYIYNLKYVQKNLNKYWRCVDYGYRKCPANVYTNDKNEVVRRRSTHNHPFHDQKIMKKLRLKLIFGAFAEAEDRGRSRKVEDIIETEPCSDSEFPNTK